MTINWNTIRPLNGNQYDGFEELVCQIAGKEHVESQEEFWRVGNPDGGKECYWKLKNGSLYCWQAKFFTKSLSPSEWRQVDKSIRSAIDNHPNLKKYFISIPIDMPDGKVNGKTSMFDKWKAKVKDWKDYASAKIDSDIEVEYWGSSELIKRLSKPENEGLRHFWFNENEFTNDWFRSKNKESFNSLGSRYTQELNFELPISKVFHGFSRDISFKKEFDHQVKEALKKHHHLHPSGNSDNIRQLYVNLKELIEKFANYYQSLPLIGNRHISFVQLEEKLDKILKRSGEIIELYFELRYEEEKDEDDNKFYGKRYASEIEKLNEISRSLLDLKDFINSPTCSLANQPFLILSGDAGVGKSHLLADVVKERNKNGHLSLFLLGENFLTRQMPWTQILQDQLRKGELDEFAFLGALNAKAESIGSRIVVFIDALNEGQGRSIWPGRLNSFVELFKKYPWLGIVVSIRSSYADLIAPPDRINEDIISTIKHVGFSGIEYEASKYFFDHYEILQPSIPLLHPEFQNPLFLKLFCESLNKRNLREVPSGYEGITTIIDYYVESIDLKLSKPDELYYDEKQKLVRKAVDIVLEAMVSSGDDYIEYDRATDLITFIFKDLCVNREPYLKRLISEGVFNIDLLWSKERGYFEIVHFAYQRFQDHLIISLLLDRYLDNDDPNSSFQKGRLNKIIKDEQTCRYNQNLIEALSVQVPERTGIELFQVVPSIKEYYSVAEAFIKSLVWRKSGSINAKSDEYINSVIVCHEHLFYEFIEEIIAASMKPEFYFNADRLNRALIKNSLSERDEWWTTWLQDKYGSHTRFNSVKRVIEWSWNENDKSHIEDESIRLGSITLSWFLTSANRYLRDGATKGLVCLLQNRIHLLKPLLKIFKDVNDPYIIERLYAVAYGVVLRSEITDSLTELSEFIYQTIFAKEYVYPHILLRDYARGIIEYTISEKLTPEVDLDRVRPPYNSIPLPQHFPSNKEIDYRYKPEGESGHHGREEWGAGAIIRSMTTEHGRGMSGYGDFGRYTFQSALRNWNVDYDGLSNYAVERIFELGYDCKLFNDFDLKQGRGHTERIGKKYQWIVFYELLAKVSDQFELNHESSWNFKKSVDYNGPWYPYVRDIDPTMIIGETGEERYEEYTSNWWFDHKYSNWELSDYQWIRSETDLPEPTCIIKSTDPDKNEWIWLNLQPNWYQPEKLMDDGLWDSKRKQLWYNIRSYLIRDDDQDVLSKFRDNSLRGFLPQARNLYQIFSREFYWSPAFNYFLSFYHRGEDWTDIRDHRDDVHLGKVAKTAEYFNWEEQFDCSKTKGAISFYKPTKIIFEGMNLKNNLIEGELYDQNDQLVCLDPSVNNKSISGLLVRREALLGFLDSQNLSIVWQVFGEKLVSGISGDKNEYLGRLNVHGIYRVQNNEIVGHLDTILED